MWARWCLMMWSCQGTLTYWSRSLRTTVDTQDDDPGDAMLTQLLTLLQSLRTWRTGHTSPWFTIYTRTKKNNFYKFNQVLCNHKEYTDVREEVWHRNCCSLLIYQSQLLIQSSLQQWIQWVMLVMIMRVVSLILMIYLHSMSGTECVLKIVTIKKI